MTPPARALIVNSSYFGLAALEPDGFEGAPGSGHIDAPSAEDRSFNSAAGESPIAPAAPLAARIVSWAEAPDGRALPRREETLSGEALTARRPAFDSALSPYRFGLQAYDPFESLAASLDRAAEQGASLSLAVWAAMEADLFRFAFDPAFTAALDDARGSADWLRFARLNDLYRACVRAIAPLGIVPSAWNAWLRDDGNVRFPASGAGRTLERILTRPIVSITGTLCSS